MESETGVAAIDGEASEIDFGRTRRAFATSSYSTSVEIDDSTYVEIDQCPIDSQARNPKYSLANKDH